MVGNDSVSGIDAVLVFVAQQARIRFRCIGELLDFVEQRLENVSVVVGLLVLQDGD